MRLTQRTMASLFVGDQVSKFYDLVRPKLPNSVVRTVYAYTLEKVCTCVSDM
jgi:hypothetical protein